MKEYLIKLTKFLIRFPYCLYFMLAVLIGFMVAIEHYSVPIVLVAIFFLLFLMVKISEKNHKQISNKISFFRETKSIKFRVHRARRFLLMVFLAIIFLNIFAPANPNLKQRVLASLIIVFSALQTYFFLKDSEESIAFMPIFGAVYSLYYAIPIFVLEKYKLDYLQKDYISDAVVEKALFLSLLGLLVLLFAYHKWPGNFMERILPKIKLNWNLQKAKIVAIIIGIIGLGTYYFIISYNVPVFLKQILNFISDFSLISIGILFVLQIKKELDFSEKVFLWGILVPFRAILGFSIGATYSGVIVFIFLFFIYFTHRRLLPWKSVIIILLCLIPLVGMRSEFRKATWQDSDYKNIPDKSILYVKMAASYFKGKALTYSELFRIFSYRTAGLMLFSYIIERTPESIPYWRGYTYFPLFTKFIPRIFYPNKPEENLGQFFGHRYGVLFESDEKTSINLSQLVEMYINFGVIGIIIGMFILGIIYKSLMVMFGYKRSGKGGLLIGFFIFTNLLLIESNFSLVVGGIFYSIILLILLNKLISTSKNESFA